MRTSLQKWQKKAAKQRNFRFLDFDPQRRKQIDRFWQRKPSTFHSISLQGEEIIVAYRKSAPVISILGESSPLQLASASWPLSGLQSSTLPEKVSTGKIKPFQIDPKNTQWRREQSFQTVKGMNPISRFALVNSADPVHPGKGTAGKIAGKRLPGGQARSDLAVLKGGGRKTDNWIRVSSVNRQPVNRQSSNRRVETSSPARWSLEKVSPQNSFIVFSLRSRTGRFPAAR